MLPSNTGEIPFTQFQQSFYSSTFFEGLNGNDSALHHHHDLLVHHVVSATDPPAASEAVNDLVGLAKPALTYGGQDMDKFAGDHRAPLGNIPRKRPVKRDRHSKIVTAQGPRDRRVRLSIDIAHKFFGLQDVLGFDKASKTLDWLLTKSKTAIEEVMQKKHTSNNEIANTQSSVSESEAAAENGDSEGKPLENSNKVQAENHPQKAARESRANARARARERARKKMCTMAEKLPTQNQTLPSSLPIAAKRSDSHIYHLFTNAMAAKEMIQEPLSIHRKTNKPSSVSGLLSNLIFSTDAKLDEDSCFSYTTQNWDTAASSVARSSIAAMDNISSSSKVLQSCGSPWEV